MVHMVGGVCGLVGTFFLGPRLGLFQESIFTFEIKTAEKMQKVEI